MNQKTREEFIDLFAEGFAGVVAPEIDSLRKDMEEGFAGVNKRLQTVENSLESVENRLETVENRLEAVEVKLDRVAANQRVLA